jgi:hypothetical protein
VLKSSRNCIFNNRNNKLNTTNNKEKHSKTTNNYFSIFFWFNILPPIIFLWLLIGRWHSLETELFTIYIFFIYRRQYFPTFSISQLHLLTRNHTTFIWTMKTLGVNFTNILRSALLSVFFQQKSTNLKCKYKKPTR